MVPLDQSLWMSAPFNQPPSRGREPLISRAPPGASRAPPALFAVLAHHMASAANGGRSGGGVHFKRQPPSPRDSASVPTPASRSSCRLAHWQAVAPHRGAAAHTEESRDPLVS